LPLEVISQGSVVRQCVLIIKFTAEFVGERLVKIDQRLVNLGYRLQLTNDVAGLENAFMRV